MAVEKVPVSGATIKIKANGGVATAIQTSCIEGTWSIDFGSYDQTKLETSCGVVYEKGSLPSFASTEWKGKLDGAMVDEAQVLFFQALYNTGDFAIDNSLNVEIEFDNSKGVNGTKYVFDVLVLGGKSDFDPKGKLSLNFSLQQVTIPVVTATA